MGTITIKSGKMYYDDYEFADYQWQYAIEYIELKLAVEGNKNSLHIDSGFVEIKGGKAYATKLY